jgi:hypothetical protein
VPRSMTTTPGGTIAASVSAMGEPAGFSDRGAGVVRGLRFVTRGAHRE